MSMNDPIADMLARIRNGQAAGHKVVRCPWSTHKVKILDVMSEEGYIRGYKLVDMTNNRKEIQIELKYVDGQGAIREMSRVSKPGRRTYFGSKDIPSVRNGLGITIISTPHGVMTDQRARAQNVGGEAICKVF
jgi:small subunit ribosomal protein S8